VGAAAEGVKARAIPDASCIQRDGGCSVSQWLSYQDGSTWKGVIVLFLVVLSLPMGEGVDQKKAKARTSMLSRGGAPGGVVGSAKALCTLKRARPSVALSKHLISSASSRRSCGK
jgi:hypothetical protein